MVLLAGKYTQTVGTGGFKPDGYEELTPNEARRLPMLQTVKLLNVAEATSKKWNTNYLWVTFGSPVKKWYFSTPFGKNKTAMLLKASNLETLTDTDELKDREYEVVITITRAEDGNEYVTVNQVNKIGDSAEIEESVKAF